MELSELKKELEIRKTKDHVDEARRMAILKNSNQILSVVEGNPTKAFIVCMEELAELISAKLDFVNCGIYTKTPDADTKLVLEEEIADVQISIDKVCDMLNIDISDAKKEIENDDTDHFVARAIPVTFNASETIKSISKFLRYQDTEDSDKYIQLMVSSMIGLLVSLKEYINSSGSNMDAEEIEYIKDIKYMRQVNRDAEYLTSVSRKKMHEIPDKFETVHETQNTETTFTAADIMAKAVYASYNSLDTLSKIVKEKISSLLKEE